MSELGPLLTALRQSADPQIVECIDHLIESGSDQELNRVNALAFAAAHGLDEEKTIAAFLRAAHIGLFELSWNVLCPGCGGVLDANATLKSVHSDQYNCSLCAAGYEPTLDEMVEVTFTISPRIRRIAAHSPDSLPPIEYYRQVFWSSGIDLPENYEAALDRIILDMIELGPGEKAFLSLQLPAEFVIIFDPVTHAAQFIDVKGEPTRERQTVTLVINDVRTPSQALELRPGPVRQSIENRAALRTLPGVWVAGEALHHLLGQRKPFLTAKRLLTNQTFRDIYRTDTLDVD